MIMQVLVNFMIRKYLLFILATVLVGLSSPSFATGKTLIAVASNFQLPATRLAQAYQDKTGNRVYISSGSTGKLYAQIIHGAPFAVFLAANSREPTLLEQEGKTVSGSRFTYALGKLVLWSSDSDLLKADPQSQLREGAIKTISVANPQTAPYGEAGVKVLETMLAGRKAEFRTIRAENVSQAFQYTATGATRAGFIAYSQFLGLAEENRGSYWLVPEELYSPIEQQAILLKSSLQNKVAVDFLLFMKSVEGRRIISSYGYGVVD